MRVLTWNLFHGRSVPDTPRSLLAEFARTIAGWEWDVALLQEVPPWWPRALARAARAAGASAPTSRIWLLPLRRLAAERRPDLMKAGGGGANAILVRGRVLPGQRVRTLRRLPERRVVHGVRLADGTWVSNVHAQAHLPVAARADAARAGAATLEWAAGAPAVLGGDFNHRDPWVDGFGRAASARIDHVLVHGLRAAGPGRTLERGGLSDHPPLLAELSPAPAARSPGA
jgi:endonuclease/exonuclease/phosphatase family metal-dependent hydrolase